LKFGGEKLIINEGYLNEELKYTGLELKYEKF
jgi:hypothetical protein